MMHGGWIIGVGRVQIGNGRSEGVGAHSLNPPRGVALYQFEYWALVNALSDQSGLKKRNLLSQAEVKSSRVTQACKQVEKTLRSDLTSMRDGANSVATTLARLASVQCPGVPSLRAPVGGHTEAGSGVFLLLKALTRPPASRLGTPKSPSLD